MSGYTQCVLYDTKRSDQLFRKSASFGGKCSGGTSHEESGEVVLEGAGQGPGIGLFQRGAKALAEEGSSVREILDHHFHNSALAQLVQSGVDLMTYTQTPHIYMMLRARALPPMLPCCPLNKRLYE